MTTLPVPADRIQCAADYGIAHADEAAVACREVEMPYTAALALLEKESMGRNVWGHDEGGLFADLPWAMEVTKGAFEVFEWYVGRGHKSNGVGPCQITYPGYFPMARGQGLKLWQPLDNMRFGFGLIVALMTDGRPWAEIGTIYNAGSMRNGVNSYGIDFAAKVRAWRERFEAL